MTTKGWKGSDEHNVKAKLLLYFITHDTMKTYGGVEV
jgi:hypothetical protein